MAPAPYIVDTHALSGSTYHWLTGKQLESIRAQLDAVAQHATQMPPPVPLTTDAPAYTLQIDALLVRYTVDTRERVIVLRTVEKTR